jgi:hypothetical protein
MARAKKIALQKEEKGNIWILGNDQFQQPSRSIIIILITKIYSFQISIFPILSNFLNLQYIIAISQFQAGKFYHSICIPLIKPTGYFTPPFIRQACDKKLQF